MPSGARGNAARDSTALRIPSTHGCVPPQIKPWGANGNEADHFGCGLDAGCHRSPSAISRRDRLEFAQPQRLGSHHQQRHLRGAARRDQPEQHPARQLQRHRQCESVHRRRRHAESAILTSRRRINVRTRPTRTATDGCVHHRETVIRESLIVHRDSPTKKPPQVFPATASPSTKPHSASPMRSRPKR
jgi:hypothetical protein